MNDKIEINVKIKEYERQMRELNSQIKSVEADISKLKTRSQNKQELGSYKDEKTIERARQKIQKDIEEQETRLHKLQQEYIKEKSLALSDEIYNIEKDIKSLKARKEKVHEIPIVGREFSSELYEKKYAELQKEINTKSATLIKLQEQKKAFTNKAIEREARAIRRAQIAEKKNQVKGPIFEAAPSEFDKATYEKEHKYVHIGDSVYTTKKIRPGTKIDLNKIRKMSVTNIAGVLTGNKFGDYNEQTLKAMQKELASLQGKELTPEYTKLSEEIKKAQNIIRAGKRGTAFHKIVELIETTDLTVEQLTKDKIKELEALYPKEIGQGSRNDYTRERLINMAKDYERLKKESGLSGKVTTEKSLGFLAQIGDEIVEITGTFDSFFSQLGTLLDFKTTSTVDPKKVGIQLNLLKKAIELHGGDVSGLKILHTPFRTGGKTGVTGSSLYSVGEIDDEVMQGWIKNAFAGIAMEVPTLLKSTLESYSWEKGGETHSSWMLNKIPIVNLPNIIEQGRLDEVVDAVKGLSPDDYKHFLNLLWSTKQYGEGKPAAGIESDKLYRSGAAWDALRRALPSFYTGLRSATGISEESFVDEEGNVSGATTVGGGFLSQWSKAYRLKLAQSGEQAAQEIVDQFVKIVKESTDEIGQEETFGRLTSLSFKDDIHNVFIDAVGKSLYGDAYEGFGFDQVGINERSKEENTARAIRSQKRSGERQYKEQGRLVSRLRGLEEVDISGFNPQQLLTFVKGISSLKYRFKGALDEMGAGELSQLNEAGMPEFIENSDYLLDRWSEFVRTIKEKIKPITDSMEETAKQTGDWKDINFLSNALNNLMLTEDTSALAVKTAHRFSWLYQAKDIYDEMLSAEEPVKSGKMSVGEWAQQRLTPEQLEQYEGSIWLRSITEGEASIENIINKILNTSVNTLKGELAKGIQDSLFKLKNMPGAFTSNEFLGTILKQTTLGGGESRKMKWWESHSAIEYLKRGETIGVFPESESYAGAEKAITSLEDKIEKINEFISGIDEESDEMVKSLDVNKKLFAEAYKAKNKLEGSTDPNAIIRTFDEALGFDKYIEIENELLNFAKIHNIKPNKTFFSGEAEGPWMTRRPDDGSEEVRKYNEQQERNYDKYLELVDKLSDARENITEAARAGGVVRLAKMRTDLLKDEREIAKVRERVDPTSLDKARNIISVLSKSIEELKALPAIQKEERKTAETKVDSDKTEVVADTVVIGEAEKKPEEKKATKRRGRPRKKKAEETPSEELPEAPIETGTPPAASGGGEDNKKPPKSGGRKRKTDEEKAADKAQAEVEKQQKRDIKDYQQYVNKVVSLESQIDKLQKQAALSTGKHREAIYGAVDALNEEIGDLNRNNEALVKRVSTEQAATKASIDSTAALKKETNAQKNLVGVKGATSIWDMMTNDIQRATMRIADFGVAAKLLNKIPQDVQKIIQYTKELDKVMTDIRIVTGATADEVEDMMRDYGNAARELGVTLTEVGGSASEWMRQGYEGAEVLDLIESSTKLATLGFMSQTDATKSLTAMMKSFNIAANDTIDIVDKLTKLDQVSAISAGELAEGISRVATTAQQAGLSIDQTAAAISVLTEQTQRDAGSMGDALRTIIVRFQNVKAGVYSSMDETSGESSELTENLSDVEKVLSKVGIRVRNSAYEFRNIYDVLDELAAKWDTLDSVTKSATGGAFAGQRQREQFNILISQWERVKELTEESEKSAGTADQKYTAYMDSMEAATKRLQNAWESFTQSLETSPIIKTLTNATALLVENADKLKYLAIALAVAQSSKIFNFFDPNGGAVGGFKGLIANIPIIGTGTKTNNLLESLDMNVKAMRGMQEKEASLQAKDRRKSGNLLKNAFGFGDIYDPKTGTSISRKTLSLYKKSQSGKINLAKNWLGYTAGLADDEREFLRLAATVKREDAQGQMEEYDELLKKRKAQDAAIGAATALIAGVASNKNVDSGMLAGLINKTGETMQETEEGKAWRVGNSTIAAGIMGYFMGPAGAQLGAFLGDEFASLTSTLYHLSDLERKQRVTVAKEQLKTLESIENISEKGNQIMSEKFLDSSGYEQLNKYVENLVSELGKLDTTVSDKILKVVRDTGKTTASTISQLGDDILNATPEDRKEIQTALNVATMEQAYSQLISSQEDERMSLASLKMKYPVVLISGQHYDKILKKYGTYTEEASGLAGGIRSAQSFSPFGTTLEERLANARAAYKELGTENKAFEDFINELQQAIETERQMDRELRNSQIQIAYLKSGISDLTQNELSDLTIDGVAGKVVGALEDMGVEVRDTSNSIKSEYLTQIKSMIKADSDMAILTKGDAKRIGELETAWAEFVSVFGNAADAYEKAKNALDTGTFEEYLSEQNIQGDADALEKLVYAANPERIEQFASAWNMTTEAAKELAKTMPNLTTATGLMSTTEISEKMSKIATIFSDLSEDGKLTVENFNAILKNYPEYVNQLGDYEALIGTLGKTLTDESLIAYKNALLTTLMGDEGYYKKFKEQLPKELSKLLTGTNAKTLTDVLDLAQTNDDFAALNGELEKFLNQTYELEIDNPLRDLAIEVKEGLLDKQISNLNEQKDALSQINDERKKELEYIKAKIALEDAQKEKKRVYRAGIGWSYISDETAISEAKEKLDSLDIERQQEAIQLQIDSLEQQKEILDAIKNNEQLEAIEEALGKNGISTDVDRIAQMMSSIEFNPMTGQFQQFAAFEEQKREKALKALKESNTAYEKAVETMNKEWDTVGVERQQELYDLVKQKYGEYSTAYTTASGLGADVSDYSENGKIKQNAAEEKKLTRAKFIENVAGFKSGSDKVSFQFDGVDYSNIKIAENELSGSAHNQLNHLVKELTDRDTEIGDLVYLNGHLYIRRRDGGWGVLTDDTAANQIRAKYFLAKGSLSTQSGLTMLNEFGTEGIITPQGTLTALPSKTGVVPADITKNVWALGEVAPTLVASLKSLTQKPLSGNAGNTTYEEGQYIDNLTMNVYPTKDYDMDKLLREARAKANLTKHNN